MKCLKISFINLPLCLFQTFNQLKDDPVSDVEEDDIENEDPPPLPARSHSLLIQSFENDAEQNNVAEKNDLKQSSDDALTSRPLPPLPNERDKDDDSSSGSDSKISSASSSDDEVEPDENELNSQEQNSEQILVSKPQVAIIDDG